MKNRKMLYKFLSGLLSFTMLLEMAACSSKEGDSALQASNTAANLDPAILNFATQFEANKESFSRKCICDLKDEDLEDVEDPEDPEDSEDSEDPEDSEDFEDFEDSEDPEDFNDILETHINGLNEYVEKLQEISGRLEDLEDNNRSGEDDIENEKLNQIIEDSNALVYPELELPNISVTLDENERGETKLENAEEFKESLNKIMDDIDKQDYDMGKFRQYKGENEFVTGTSERVVKGDNISHTAVPISDLVDFAKGVNGNDRAEAEKTDKSSSSSKVSDSNTSISDIIGNITSSITGAAEVASPFVAVGKVGTELVTNILNFGVEIKKINLQKKLKKMELEYQAAREKREQEFKIKMANADFKHKKELMEIDNEYKIKMASLEAQNEREAKILDTKLELERNQNYYNQMKEIARDTSIPTSLKKAMLETIQELIKSGKNSKNSEVLSVASNSRAAEGSENEEDKADRAANIKRVDVTVNFSDGESDTVSICGRKIATGDTSWALVSIMKDDDGNIIDCVVTPINTPEKLDIA